MNHMLKCMSADMTNGETEQKEEVYTGGFFK